MKTISLTARDAAIIKGMLKRGDKQHDIAAYFGVNSGRISEINTGAKFTAVKALPSEHLPPPGPIMHLNNDPLSRKHWK